MFKDPHVGKIRFCSSISYLSWFLRALLLGYALETLMISCLPMISEEASHFGLPLPEVFGLLWHPMGRWIWDLWVRSLPEIMGVLGWLTLKNGLIVGLAV